jgi:hypothetical protein
MDSVRLSGLVSYLPSQGLDDGPVIILLGFSPIAIEQLVCLLWITLYNDSCIKIFTQNFFGLQFVCWGVKPAIKDVDARFFLAFHLA